MKKVVNCPRCDNENVVEHDLGDGRKRYDCKNYSCLNCWTLNKEGRQEPTGPSNLQTEEQIERMAQQQMAAGLKPEESHGKELEAMKKLAGAGKLVCDKCGKDDFPSARAKGQHGRFCKGKAKAKETPREPSIDDEEEDRDEAPENPIRAAIKLLEEARSKRINILIQGDKEIERIDDALAKLQETQDPT